MLSADFIVGLTDGEGSFTVFKRHPLESKRIKDFQIFCKVHDLAIAKAHHTKGGLARIAQLKAQMHA